MPRLKPENCPHHSLWRETMGGGSTGDYVCQICGACGPGMDWAEPKRRALAARDPGALGYRAVKGDLQLDILPVGEGEWESEVHNKRTHTQTFPVSGSSVAICKDAAVQAAKRKYPDQDTSDLVWEPMQP